MYIKKQVIIAVSVVILIMAFMAHNAGSEERAGFNNVSLAMSNDQLAIFDHEAGKIYIHSRHSGDLRDIVTLRELGKDLHVRGVGNLITIE